MRLIFVVLVLALSTSSLLASRRSVPPGEFKPLTQLPWKQAGATMDSVLQRIFREPNPQIRYPVLAAYLRRIPAAQLGKAFDLCVTLEGAQRPNHLVEFFLSIWAERDSIACWAQTKKLFRLVGIEHGWQTHDDWKTRPRITVQDLDAIRASSFWLDARHVLMSFPHGLERSAVSKKERLRLMKEFLETWFAAFATWPDSYRATGVPAYSRSVPGLLPMFELPAEELRWELDKGRRGEEAPLVEVAARRWMEASPESALRILDALSQIRWHSAENAAPPANGEPSVELLMIWADADLPAIIQWADPLDPHVNRAALRAKGLLMSRVDAATRERWLAKAKSGDAADERTETLLCEWAGWDPKAALDAAIATRPGILIAYVATTAAGGPFHQAPANTTHFALGVIREFDFGSLPEEVRREARGAWETVMDYWGEVDIGEAARYGVDFLLRSGYPPREGLLRFFSGHDEYPDTGDMIDRTFCALRVWAVVRPGEMKAWIATLKDPGLEKALTWLLQNPWGSGPVEE